MLAPRGENEYEGLFAHLREDYGVSTETELNSALDELTVLRTEREEIKQFYEGLYDLRKRAKDKKLELVFHVFCDGSDNSVGDPPEAMGLYMFHRTQGEPHVRLWYQMGDRELDAVENYEENRLVEWSAGPT
jgi:hypothetical protein